MLYTEALIPFPRMLVNLSGKRVKAKTKTGRKVWYYECKQCRAVLYQNQVRRHLRRIHFYDPEQANRAAGHARGMVQFRKNCAEIAKAEGFVYGNSDLTE